MTLRPAGEARLDQLTDGLLLDFGDDLYVVPLHRLAALTSRRAHRAPVSRRYPGAAGHYIDVEQAYQLKRSDSGKALIFATGPGAIYTVALKGVLDVVHGRETTAEIARIVTDAAQLSDATTRQMALEGC